MHTEKPANEMRSRMNTALYGARRSAIREFSRLARETPGCIALTLGEPDRETEETVSDEIRVALAAKETHYIENNGTLALRTAIANFEADKNGMDYSPDEVIVTAGATEALFIALFGILNPGDEVIVPTPAFVLYEEIIRLCRGSFVPFETAEDGFQISYEKLQALVTPRTKAIILNSPNNPTGVVYTRESLDAVHRIASENPLFVLCDDVYRQLIYTDAYHSFAEYRDLRDRILVAQSFSKPYAMTGWRMGYLLADRAIKERLELIHQYLVVSTPSLFQRSGIRALQTTPDAFVAACRRRRDFVLQSLAEMGLPVTRPEGAFYVFPDVSAFGLSSADFCRRMIVEVGLAATPGFCFGSDHHIRLSVCASDADLQEGMQRLRRFLERLREEKKGNDAVIDWKTEAEKISETMIALRREFHRFPELGNAEVRTSERICAYLRSLSVTVVRPFGTAVMGILHGEATDGGTSRSVALRADMDALPLTEDTGLPFASETAGVMHACGHDVHMAALLGAATMLASHRSEWRGTVRFLFEPDEEGTGGAERMIRAGCLDPDVSAVFGLHVTPELPAGQIGIRYGSFYAASNPFRITVYGKSAHGAEPEKGIDAIAAAAAVVAAVRDIPRLLSDPPSVVSVCTFRAGSAENILADRAELSGILRTFGEAARENLKETFRETVLRAVAPFGATAEIALRDSYPGVCNSEPETALAHRVACETFGKEQVTVLEHPTMTTEDFGYFILHSGGCFAHLGVGPTAPLHHPAFSPDERALSVGAAYLAAVAERALCAADSAAQSL